VVKVLEVVAQVVLENQFQVLPHGQLVHWQVLVELYQYQFKVIQLQ
jgi:hypothetical protein